jgi:hypothetical protein
MRGVTTATLAAGVLALCAGSAVAAPVDISSYVNANLQTYSNGTYYPTGPTTISIGGIVFDLAGYPGGGLGAIQTCAPGCSSSLSTFSTGPFTISVNQPDVKTVYALINSAWGVYGDTVGSLVFKDSASDTYTDPLVEGTNIRDHNQDGYNNTATGIYGTAYYGPVRLDAYQIALPAAFCDNTLVSVAFSCSGPCDAPYGAPFLAGLTAVTTPLPAALPLFVTGLGGLGLFGWRRKRKNAAAIAAA